MLFLRVSLTHSAAKLTVLGVHVKKKKKEKDFLSGKCVLSVNY